ncbi:hypothetical protein O6H91_17G040100 [Diphasiastrum complanatum]|uniref:Uncharacterized protein n=2 Tax=Diphasiastrum complanatum TaxID=34168 RepID=A0ACC2B5Y6_DIPCM|nr:hypothetical protein O6H91_17G040100 [Diphasiastrum complanatum]
MEICTSEFEDEQIMLNSEKHFEASSTMADYFHGENVGYDFDLESLEKSLKFTPNVCKNDLSHIYKADQNVTVASASFRKTSKLESSLAVPAIDEDKQAVNEDGQASYEKRDGKCHASSGVSKPSNIDFQHQSDATVGLTVSVISGAAETGMPLGNSGIESSSQVFLLEKDSDSDLELTAKGGNLLKGKSYNSETASVGLSEDVRCSSRQYYEISQHVGEPDTIMQAYSHFHYSRESSLRSHSLGPADHKDNQDYRVDRLSESDINEESLIEMERHDSYQFFISPTAELEFPSCTTDIAEAKPGQNFIQHPSSLEELIWGSRSLSPTGSKKIDTGRNEDSNMVHRLTKSISEDEDSELLTDSKEGSKVLPSDCIVLTSCDQERKTGEDGAVSVSENINLTSYDQEGSSSHIAVTSGLTVEFNTQEHRGNRHSEVLNAHLQFADSCLTFSGGSVTVELGAVGEGMHLVQLESPGRMSFQAEALSLPTASQSFVGRHFTADVLTEDQESVAQVAKVNAADFVEKSYTVDVQLHSVKGADSLQGVTETSNHVRFCTVSQQLVRMLDKSQQKPCLEAGGESTGFPLVKGKRIELGNLSVEPLGARLHRDKDESQAVHDLPEVREEGLNVSGEVDKSDIVQVTAIQLLADVSPTHDIPSITDKGSSQQEVKSTSKSTEISVMEHDKELLKNYVLQSNWSGKNERTECRNEGCVLNVYESAATGPKGEKEQLGVGVMKDSFDNIKNTAMLNDTLKLPQDLCAPVACSTTININKDLATQGNMILESAGGSTRLQDEGSLTESSLTTETFMLHPTEIHLTDVKEKMKSNQQLDRESLNQKANVANGTEGDPLVIDDNVMLAENELHVALEIPFLETQTNLKTSADLETSTSMDCGLRTDREIGKKSCHTCPEFSAEYKGRVPASLEEKNAISDIGPFRSDNIHNHIINQNEEVLNTKEQGYCKLVGSFETGTKLLEDMSVMQRNEGGEVGTKLSTDVSVIQCNDDTLQPSHPENDSFSGLDGPSADITELNQTYESRMSQAVRSLESSRDETVPSLEVSTQSSNSPQVSTNNEVQIFQHKASACLDSSSCIFPLKASRKPTSLSDIKEAFNTHQPVTEMQKVQLHSQIRVYGALLQGILPEESHMVGLNRRGKHNVNWERSLWGKAWQKAATKTREIKSNTKICPSEHSSTSTMPAISLNTFVLPTRIGKTTSKATHSIGSTQPVVDLTLQSAITSTVGSMRPKNVVSMSAIDNIGLGIGLAPTIGCKPRSSTSTLSSLVSAATTINGSFLRVATMESLRPPLTPWRFSAVPYVAESHIMNFPSLVGSGSCWVSSSYSSTATPPIEPTSATLHPGFLYTFTQAIKDAPPHIGITNSELMLSMPSNFEHVTSTLITNKGKVSKGAQTQSNRLSESKSRRNKRRGSEPSSTAEMLDSWETFATVQGMVEMAPHVDPPKLSSEIACTKRAGASQDLGLAGKPLKLSSVTRGKTPLFKVSRVPEKEIKHFNLPVSSTGLSVASNTTNVTPLVASRSEFSPLAVSFEGVSHPDEFTDSSILSSKRKKPHDFTVAIAGLKPAIVSRQIAASAVGLTGAESYNGQGAHQTVTDSAVVLPASSTCISIPLPLEVPEDSLSAREVVPVVKSMGEQGSLPQDEPDHSVASGEQLTSFQVAMGKLEEAKLLAQNTKSAALSALEWSQHLWNQSNNQGMVENDCLKESKSTVLPATIDAAISAVRAAAAAGKVAYEAVILAKCLLDESLQRGSIATLGGSMNENITENVETLAANILCSIEFAKQASAERVVAATLASKKAQILDAVVQAADLAAKAASQAGTVITLGENSLEAIVRSPTIGNKRSKGSSFMGSNSSAKKETLHRPINIEFRDANIKFSPRESKLRKSHSKTSRNIKDESRRAKGLPESKAGRDQHIQTQIKAFHLASTTNQIATAGSEVVDHDFQLNPAEVEQDERGRMEIDLFSEQDTHLSGVGNIREGVAIEVVQEENGLCDGWFKAKVLSVKGNKVLVVYDELYDSEEDCQLEEWVPLPNSEGDPPRIRLLKEDGIRKRRRATIHNQMWVLGDHVEAFINDGWWRGVVQSVNDDDERHVTVLIPGGEAVAMKSWNLRPCLTWKEGSWVPQTVSKDVLEVQEDDGQKLKVQRPSSSKTTNHSSNERKHGVEVTVSSKEKPGEEDNSLEKSNNFLKKRTSNKIPIDKEKATVGVHTAIKKKKSMVEIVETQGNTGAIRKPAQQNIGAGKRTRGGLRSEQAKRPHKTKMNDVFAGDRDEVNVDGKEDELPVIIRLEKLVNLKSYRRRNPNARTCEAGRTQACLHDKPTRLSKLVLKKHPENFGVNKHLPFRGSGASMQPN